MARIGLLSTEHPPSPLVLALAPVLAATGCSVAAAIDDFLPFDCDRLEDGGLMMLRGAGARASERIPAERVFWIGEPPFTRPIPIGRTLGKARFHEVAGLLTGKARGGALEKAVIETGAYILTGLREFDRTSAFYAMEGGLTSGTAAERFALIFGEDALRNPGEVAPLAAKRRDVMADRRGAISAWNGGPLRAALETLGPRGAIGRIAEAGFVTGPRKPVARLYGEDDAALDKAEGQVRGALKLG
ncbi:hypothetical protein [Minwuia thermotolerans]|uniref:hypothetical protein n=1 Tax=Minwuia thermotolerans TaxID=2056226 RepID=UPI000F634B82|nr:hypothetical protein [Minwuia thermotolerans]